MKTAILDGAAIPDKAALHRTLAAQLKFPAYYGGNLDALYDVLSCTWEPTVIRLRNPEALEQNLGGYFRVFLGVLADIREENDSIQTELEQFGQPGQTEPDFGIK